MIFNEKQVVFKGKKIKRDVKASTLTIFKTILI